MSRCPCAPEPDKNLNVKVLACFLPDVDGPCYDNSFPNFEYIPRFSDYDWNHMAKLRKMAKQLCELSVNEMIRILSCLKNTYPDCVFIEHFARVAMSLHKETKYLTLPPPQQTIPSLFFDRNLRFGRLEEILSRHDIIEMSKLNPEQLLSWWREDPAISSHHGNWHIYYPYTDKPIFQRQGELFAYMHEQMLARYDFERLALNMPRVEPFGPGFGWDKPIETGFNPRLAGFAARPPGMEISDTVFTDEKVIMTSIDLVRQTQELLNAIGKGFLTNENGKLVPVTMNRLGLCLEANTVGSINHNLYGNLHNDGHSVIGLICDPNGVYDIDQGSMVGTFTAARDPIFYRWHKFVDVFFETYRKLLKPYTIKDWMVLPDIEITSLKTVIQIKNSARIPANSDLTNNFYSYMGKKNVTIYDPKPKVITTSRVKKTVPFNFKLSVKNNGRKDIRAVFRVFMVPDTKEPIEFWRLLAVELDRFCVSINAGERKEIIRSDKDSSVILPPEKTIGHIMQGDIHSKPPCGCGWPANLLIPRGTPSGMKAKLYVLATNWAEDGVDPREELSGSVAYCGKLGKPYPDKKPMGFPFDRSTTWEEVKGKSGKQYLPSFDQAIIAKVPNAAMAEVKLNYMMDNRGSPEDSEESENEEASDMVFNEKYEKVSFSSESSSDYDELAANFEKTFTCLKFPFG